MSTPRELTIDEFRQRIDASEAKCEICGFTAHSIVKHLKLKHNMTPTKYRDLYPSARLFSIVVGEILRRMDRKAATSSNFEEHLNYFSGNVPTAKVLEDFKGKLTYDPAFDEFIPTAMSSFVFEPQDRKIAYALWKGKNVFVSGPTGCGKTEAYFQVLNRLRVPVRRVNMHGDVTTKNFIGSKEAGPNGTFFKEGILPWCMQNGIPLLVDEFDYTPPHIAAILHPVLEPGRRTYVPDAGREYVAKPGFTILATANTKGKGDDTGVYTGTEIINTATLDRFPIKLSKTYLSEKAETELLNGLYPGEGIAFIQKMTKLAADIRTAFLQGNLSVTLSTRKMIEFFEQKAFFGTKEALQSCMLDWLTEDDVSLVTQIMDRIQLEKV